MVLPTDKSAEAFNVAVARLNFKYSSEYGKITKQVINSDETMSETQLDVDSINTSVKAHQRVTNAINTNYSWV